MPIQIRVVIPNASPGDEDSTGVGEKGDSPAKSALRRKNSSAKPVRQFRRHRPASAPVSRVQLPVKTHDVTMHVASIYDVENEHDYIMGKALQAYRKHRQSEEQTVTPPPRDTFPPPSTTNHHPHLHHHQHHHHQGRRFVHTSNSSNEESATTSLRSPSSTISPKTLRSSSSSSSSSTLLSKTSPSTTSSSPLNDRRRPRGFKLSLCTLKDTLGKDLGPLPHSHSSPGPGPGIVSQQRPWSASPHQGRLDAIRQVSLVNGALQLSVKTTRPVHQHRLHVRTLHLLSKMDPPISRSAAYNLRNRTTHAWTGDNDPTAYHPSSPDFMTMSCPSPRSLEEHMRSARTSVPRDPNPSPVVVKGRAVLSPSSPQPRDRPSSAYSYDGGLFLSAGSFSSKDYFVIHPDWVSEAMTVQKLSLNERQGRPQSRSSGQASARRGWGKDEEEEEGENVVGKRRFRRCKSAPATKNRNPITWSS
ncbi:hypothetical protein ACOMHN_050036 [Nucella lapillus]